MMSKHCKAAPPANLLCLSCPSFLRPVCQKGAKKYMALRFLPAKMVFATDSTQNVCQIIFQGPSFDFFQMASVCVVLGSVREGRMGLRIAKYDGH